MAIKKIPGTKDDIPVFLKKTFHLINTCDPKIATWSDDGLTFVVKDPSVFSSEIIPQFFKHNNFSSFVRQLNFYGFRKIKNDTIHILEDDDVRLDWWQFKHENFIRGRPDLLKHIKKASQIDAATKEDVDRLKQEVGYLRSMVTSMASQLQQLTGHEITIDETRPLSNKKRKIDGGSPIPDMNTSTSMPPPSYAPVRQHHHQPNFDHTEMLTDQDLLVEDIPLDIGYQSGTVTPPTMQRIRSADILESMFDFIKEDNLEDPKPDASHSSSSAFNRSVSYQEDNTQPAQLDSKLAAKLNNAVANLPPSLQESFIERLVSQIASPDVYKKHCDAVGVLATAAAIEAQNQTMISNAQADAPDSDGTNNQNEKLSMNNQSEMTLPVAAAALGAFLSKYGNAANNPNPLGEVYEPVKQ